MIVKFTFKNATGHIVHLSQTIEKSTGAPTREVATDLAGKEFAKARLNFHQREAVNSVTVEGIGPKPFIIKRDDFTIAIL